jgi:hypothetical protein
MPWAPNENVPHPEMPPNPAVVGGSAGAVTVDDLAVREDWPRRSDSLLERFLNNLRLALSIPHT